VDHGFLKTKGLTRIYTDWTDFKTGNSNRRSFDSALCAIAQDDKSGADDVKMRKPFGLRMGEF